MAAKFVVEVLVGGKNVTLVMEDRGEGIHSLDTGPLRVHVDVPAAQKIGAAILCGLTMGDVVSAGEEIGWIAWTASYVEGSAISEELEARAESLRIGRA